MSRTRLLAAACGFLLAAAGCMGPPEGVAPVEHFQIDRYLGTWYEIARLDHRFERGMSNVSARYERRSDGAIRVINRGFKEKSGNWESIEGKAYPAGEAGTGSLKVSFFGPFYGGYHVIALDRESYRYAMVAGPNRSYLWILARQPSLPKQTLDRLLAKARELGFATEKLIFVAHDRPQT
jgi:apolipoprotein D and lipocalin family protein